MNVPTVGFNDIDAARRHSHDSHRPPATAAHRRPAEPIRVPAWASLLAAGMLATFAVLTAGAT